MCTYKYLRYAPGASALPLIRIGALSVSFVSMRRLLDAEPEGFTGGMTLRKAISLTKVSRAYRIHWPGRL